MKEIRTYDFTAIEANVKAYVEYMLDRTQSMFKWENLPDTIDERTLERRLQENGFVIFCEVKESEIIPFEEVKQEGGVYAMNGNFGGVLDFNGNPQFAIVVHPLLKDSKKLYMKKDCVLARNDSKMLGFLPMFIRYARAIVENDLSLFRADQQTRATAILSVNDNKGLESAKKYIESIKKGDLGFVMQESKAMPSIKTQPYFSEAGGQITNLIELEQFLKGSWFNEVGINANFNMKRETILESENDLNSDAIQPLVDQMLHERERACEAINEMFGLNVSVKLHSVWNKEQKMHEIDEEVESSTIEEEGEVNDELEQTEETVPEDVPEEVQESEEETVEESASTDEQDTETDSDAEPGSSEEEHQEGDAQDDERSLGAGGASEIVVNVNIDTAENVEVEEPDQEEEPEPEESEEDPEKEDQEEEE